MNAITPAAVDVRPTHPAHTAREAAAAFWRLRPLDELIEHIVTIHHAHDRDELARLEQLAIEATQADGPQHPELDEVRRMIQALARDLEPHMMKEEAILFPYILELEADGPPPVQAFGTITHPLRLMTGEHHVAAGILRELRMLTDDFEAEADLGPSSHALYRGLAILEQEVYVHMHLEDDVLYPAAVRLEARRAGEEVEP